MGFAERLSALMSEQGTGVRATARRVPCDPALVSRLAAGRQRPSVQIARRLDEILSAGGELVALAGARPVAVPHLPAGELGAVEATRRAGATDVGPAAVERLEQICDALAVAYASTAPADLLARSCAYLDYATGLLGGRMTLGEHRRLLVTSGWLSLLAATSLIDQRRWDAGAAYLATAASLAAEAEHTALRAWVLETRAWQALITGDYQRAVALALGAQEMAPGGSVLIQAAAQEGRAWARLGAVSQTRGALARVEALSSQLPPPDLPEHHYVYDPGKAEAYLATTLTWIADPAAEGYARRVLARIESGADGPPRPRRATAARLDLALALAVAGDLEEAAFTGRQAMTSGWLVPSHHWRAREVITAISAADAGRAAELADTFKTVCEPPDAIES